MSETKYPCLILCGGASQRFEHGHKAMAKLGDKSVLQHVIDRISPQVSQIAINAAHNVGFERFNLPLRPDGPGESKGPLAGVVAAMEWAEHSGYQRVLTCSNDTPFVPTDLVSALEVSAADMISVPVHNGQRHFVCALWPTALRESLRDYLKNGGRAVQGFIQSQPVEYIELNDKSGVDLFFNVNRSDDLRTAERMLQELTRL